MSSVPDKVLNWLYSVLTSEYVDVNRTYKDTAQTLTTYPSLSPRTEVYTYENGASALLLLVSGTIPVEFRRTIYRFPIAIWVPHAYPREAPIVYVTPVDGMLVRPGQHVSGDGKVYHPYLAKWAGFWDKSSLLDFIAILRDVFAKEPPVISKQQAQIQTSTAEPTPPPPPPVPEDWRRSQHPPTHTSAPQDSNGPPPLPPKGANVSKLSSILPPSNRQDPSRGPPLPPLPPQQTPQQRYPPQQRWQDPAPRVQPQVPFPPSRHASLESTPSPYTPNNIPSYMRYQQPQHELEGPVSPIAPADFPSRNSLPLQQHRASSIYHEQRPTSQAYQYPLQQPPIHASQPPPQQRRPLQPPVDLLSSPLDVQLPSQTGDASAVPVPPVPPNPEKDALLSALSQALVSQAHEVIGNNASAVQSLTVQHCALRSAHSVFQSELNELVSLSSILESNERVLRQAMHEADQSIQNASRARRPEIDEVLVCPTVVGGQIYSAVAEEKATGDVKVALGRGLDRGRIGAKTFVNQMRAVGREEFFRKAIVEKAGKGMGLDIESRSGWR